MKQFLLKNWLGGLILLTSHILYTPAIAQVKAYQQAVDAYEAQDYEYALTRLNQVIENKYLIRGKDVPKAYYLRAKVRTEYYRVLMTTNNTKKLFDHKGILIEAYDDLFKARSFDDGECSDITDDTHGEPVETTPQFGQTATDSLPSPTGIEIDKVDSLISIVEKELNLIDLDSDLYLIKETLGIMAYKSGNYQMALSYLKQSRSLYKQNPPLIHDLQHVYNYYFTALIYHYQHLDFSLALEEVIAGREFLVMGLLQTEQTKQKQIKKEVRSLRKLLENLEFEVKLLKN